MTAWYATRDASEVVNKWAAPQWIAAYGLADWRTTITVSRRSGSIARRDMIERIVSHQAFGLGGGEQSVTAADKSEGELLSS